MPPWYTTGPPPTAVSCQHNGVANLSQCVCLPGYTGAYCQEETPEDACQNGSTAVGAKCVCVAGFYGPRCQHYNSSMACQNGGTPVGTDCACLPGYDGARCESSHTATTATPVTMTTHSTTIRSTTTTTVPTTTRTTTVPTTTTPAPCQNGGTHNGIKCICQDGYYGSQCEESKCQNGGTWSNGGCLCPSSFQGPACEYASEVIEVKAEVNVTVDVKLQITSHKFTPKLEDNTTQEYKEFTVSFKQQMNLVYSKVPGYKDVRILKLTQGSVVVDHIVILALPVTGELNTDAQKVAGQLKTQIETAAENQNCNSSSSMMCFNASSADVSNGTMPTVNISGYCWNVAPEGYAQFYFPNLTKSGFSCISNCTKSTPGFMDCHHGQCQVTRAGPQCICSETDLYWYPTERCATRVSKLGAGLGVAIAVLLILSIVLGAFLFRAKRMKTQFGLHSDDDDTEKWYENAYSEWNTAGSFCIRNEGADSGKGSDGTGSFKVNMESIDTALPVHIQRPEIVVTQL